MKAPKNPSLKPRLVVGSVGVVVATKERRLYRQISCVFKKRCLCPFCDYLTFLSTQNCFTSKIGETILRKVTDNHSEFLATTSYILQIRGTMLNIVQIAIGVKRSKFLEIQLLLNLLATRYF